MANSDGFTTIEQLLDQPKQADRLDAYELEAMRELIAERARVEAMFSVWSSMVTRRRGITGQITVAPDGIIQVVAEKND